LNLFYLIAKNNGRFAKSTGVEPLRQQRNGLTWRGVKVDNQGGSLRVDRATECQPFRSRRASVEWYAQSLSEASELIVRFLDGSKTLSERRVALNRESFEPILLPWPVDPFASELDLEIACSGPSPAFIACHFELNRRILFDRCKGRGVELGPGPNPHIRQGVETTVLYVEQRSPAEWLELYGDHYKVGFDPDLEPFYVVGDAHQVPAEPGSLDFVYSSHVFEHLVNPLGHLELWSSLLRRGGEVVMVIPDYIGSKDYLVEASSIEEILAEYDEGTFVPSMRHYQKYAIARGDPGKAAKLHESGSSIHMHYYGNDNMRQLLDYAVRAGLFRRFTILHSANAKDFHVILTR
jgi:predicted SAM-dependent methyltransferase